MAPQQADHLDVVIISSEKDMCSFVSDRITLLDTMRGTVTGADAVQEKYSMPPEKIIEIFSLMGDRATACPASARRPRGSLSKPMAVLTASIKTLMPWPKKQKRPNREKAYLKAAGDHRHGSAP